MNILKRLEESVIASKSFHKFFIPLTQLTLLYGILFKYSLKEEVVRKRNKFWAFTMALVLSGGVMDDGVQQTLSKALEKNPEIFSKIIFGYPENFVQVTQNLLQDEEKAIL